MRTPSTGSRAARAALAAILLCGGAALAEGKGTPSGPGSLAGLWVNSDYKTSARFDVHAGILRTDEGQLPPFQPAAAALFEQRVMGAEAGRPFAITKAYCLPAGVPQAMFGPALPIEILETPGKVSILMEEFTNFRQIFLDGQHQKDPEPSFMGDSVGRWEQGELVVDTVALSERTTLDPLGMPHSDALHITERFHRTGDKTMELRVTFDDPKTFTRTWT
ncbi:MAG TPA: hypothetical protein VGG92_14200, partial [Caulobacteraceae bacterium]